MDILDSELSPLVAVGDSYDHVDARCRLPSRTEVEAAVRTLIAATGDNPDREGLLETPARVARAYTEWFAGYWQDPAKILGKVFSQPTGFEEVVVLRDIPLVSTCEHHMAPITGFAHIAYKPRDGVVGISKLSRLVDLFSRRLQLQERLTCEIATALDQTLRPRGIGVVIEASHGCMSTRGVNQHGISMVTKCWLGEFKTNSAMRQDLLSSL
jgi:GTP cyclohydrolase I